MMFSNVGQLSVQNRMSLALARSDRRGKRSELPDDIAKKLKSCSVLNCEDWRDLTSYTTYHCFPTGEKNQERWEIWTQLLRKVREDDSWIPFRGSLVCSHHFRSEDFVNDPLSKRRKLIKNAIPSIFPTFTVDLSDPSYHLPDDDGEGCEGEGTDGGDGGYIYAADSESGNYFNEEDDDEVYEYEYPTDADTQAFQPVTSVHKASTSAVKVPQSHRRDDDDIQIISHTPRVVQVARSSAPPPPPPTQKISPTIVTSVGQVQIISTSTGVFQQRSQIVKNSPSSNKGQQRSTAGNTAVIKVQNAQPRSMTIKAWTKNVDIQQQLQQRKQQRANNLMAQQNAELLRKKAREEEAKKVLNELPFAINPDLEVDMVDPVEDLAACRVRIIELEQENRSLITMYENTIEGLRETYDTQIQTLRKLVKDQEILLNLNQISVTLPSSSSKRARLS